MRAAPAMAVAALAALLIQACKVGPNYQQPHEPLPPRYSGAAGGAVRRFATRGGRACAGVRAQAPAAERRVSGEQEPPTSGGASFTMRNSTG